MLTHAAADEGGSEHAELDSRLARDSIEMGALPLCQVRLMDAKEFPWVILVPQRPQLREIIDLPREDRFQLMDEIAGVSEAMQCCFAPDKLNIAALGNIVSQLHIHVIARYESDRAWPSPVWGASLTPMSAQNRHDRISAIFPHLAALSGWRLPA